MVKGFLNNIKTTALLVGESIPCENTTPSKAGYPFLCLWKSELAQIPMFETSTPFFNLTNDPYETDGHGYALHRLTTCLLLFILSTNIRTLFLGGWGGCGVYTVQNRLLTGTKMRLVF